MADLQAVVSTQRNLDVLVAAGGCHQALQPRRHVGNWRELVQIIRTQNRLHAPVLIHQLLVAALQFTQNTLGLV